MGQHTRAHIEVAEGEDLRGQDEAHVLAVGAHDIAVTAEPAERFAGLLAEKEWLRTADNVELESRVERHLIAQGLRRRFHRCDQRVAQPGPREKRVRRRPGGDESTTLWQRWHWFGRTSLVGDDGT